MSDEVTTTFRLVELGDPQNVGQTALTEDLARLATGHLLRLKGTLLSMERTDWVEKNGKMVPGRTVVVAAETEPHEWVTGPREFGPR
jgi:hypothetical protein